MSIYRPQRPLQWFRKELETLEEIRDKDTKAYLSSFNDVKQRNEAGIAKDCMATYSLSKSGNQGMTDVEIAFALSAPFSAGVDTVSLRFCVADRVFTIHRLYRLSGGVLVRFALM
jgi:hypothetical protein